MALTRSYKERVLKRIQERPKFARSLFNEAINSLLDGDIDTCLSLLKKLVHARVTFKTLSEETDIPEKSLHRMLGQSGNPKLENLIAIIKVIEKKLGLAGSFMAKPVKGKKLAGV